MLIRKIGEGGFGEVWLAKSETTGAWKALKWISRASHRHLNQELEALKRYSTAISGARSPHLVPIEHVRLLDEALIYVMPLADGFDELTPDDPEWEPVTLSAIMARHAGSGTWLSLDEVKRVIDGVLQGASVVADAGLQHRDIKPENVLFIGGEAALGDFGLAADDMTQVSMRGTPHHSAPSWYFESGGNADQWGIAILLYQLLTGNSPDKIGKPKYQVPSSGMGALSQQQKDEWNRLQSLVNRATSEVPSERFQGFESFSKALHGAAIEVPRKRIRLRSYAIGSVIALVVAFVVLKFGFRPSFLQKVRLSDQATNSSSPVKRVDLTHLDPNQMPAPVPTGTEDKVQHIYSEREINLMNSIITNKSAMDQLVKDNEARYRRVIKSLPTNANLMDIIKKMQEE